MNRALVLCIMTATLCSSPATLRAQTDQTDYQLRLPRDGLIWHLAAAPLYFLWGTALHEGSHALTAKALGYAIDEFKPYPHIAKLDDGTKLLVGGVTVIRDPVRDRDMVWIAAAPFIADAVVFLASDLALGCVDPRSEAAPILLFGGMMMPWSDIANGLLSALMPESDIRKFQKLAGAPAWAIAVVGGAITVAATVRLWQRADRVLFLPAAPDAAGLPSAAAGLTNGRYGLSYGFRF